MVSYDKYPVVRLGPRYGNRKTVSKYKCGAESRKSAPRVSYVSLPLLRVGHVPLPQDPGLIRVTDVVI